MNKIFCTVLWVIMTFGPLVSPALAWDSGQPLYKLKYVCGLEKEPRRNKCLGATTTWLRADDGSKPARLHYKLPNEKELSQLTKKWSVFMTESGWDYQVNFVSGKQALRGLRSEDGKTTYLPTEFLNIMPISSKAAYVKTIGQNWLLARFGEHVTYERTPPGRSFNVVSGGSPESPLKFLLWHKTQDGMADFEILDNDGVKVLSIPNVLLKDNANPINYYHLGKVNWIVFRIRQSADVEGSAWVDMMDQSFVRMGNEVRFLEYHNARAEFPKSLNSYYGLVERLASSPESIGPNTGPDMYLPYHENGTPVNREHFVGIIPIYDNNRRSGAAVGYITVFDNGTDRWYDYRKPRLRVNWVLHPPNAAVAAVAEPIIADIYYGSPDFSVVRQTVLDETGASPSLNNPAMFLFRFYENSSLGGAGGITNWYRFDPKISTLNAKNYRESKNEQLIGDPSSLAMGFAVARQIEYIKGVQAANRSREYAAQQYQRSIEYARGQMARGEKVVGDGNFWKVALNEGNPFLSYYMRERGGLPNLSYAGEICRRFGNASGECNKVMGWAGPQFAAQEELRRKANSAYAEQVELTRRRPPTYRPPSKAPRCYSQGNGYEKCFYD